MFHVKRPEMEGLCTTAEWLPSLGWRYCVIEGGCSVRDRARVPPTTECRSMQHDNCEEFSVGQGSS